MEGRQLRSVAVVGAGMAGLACAGALGAAGVGVRVFEKSRGPGGRICTRRIDGLRFDHGAPGFEVRAPAFLRQVEAWEKAGVASPDPITPVRWSRGEWEVLARPKRWLGEPRMSALGRHLATGLDLRLETQVAQLERCSAGWRLHDAQGANLGEYAFVILACPAPQAAALLPTDSPLFAAASSVRFAPAWVLMWHGADELRLAHTHVEIEDFILKLAFSESPRPGRASGSRWMIHAGAEWSREHLEDEAEGVAQALARRFESLFELEPARQTWAHRWRYAAIESAAVGPTVDSKRGLALVGDGTAGPGVEAAWRAGRALAEQLLGDDMGAPDSVG